MFTVSMLFLLWSESLVADSRLLGRRLQFLHLAIQSSSLAGGGPLARTIFSIN